MRLLTGLLTLSMAAGCGDGASNDGTSAPPEFGICGGALSPPSNPATPADATAVHIAATPRENDNLEALALRLTGGFIADQGVYDRVVGDIKAILSGAPDLADIHSRHSNDHLTVLLRVERDTFNAMQEGTYAAWDTLNDRYGVINVEYSDFYPTLDDMVLLRTKGNYDIDALAAEYAPLEGVLSAGPNYRYGDGSELCAAIEGQTTHYMFDRAGGDCPSGCTVHDVRYFICEVGSQPAVGGEWASELWPPPDWLQQYGRGCY